MSSMTFRVSFPRLSLHSSSCLWSGGWSEERGEQRVTVLECARAPDHSVCPSGAPVQTDRRLVCARSSAAGLEVQRGGRGKKAAGAGE